MGVPGERAEDLSRFEVSIEVGHEHIDGLGHVNNVVYLGWMQQAATAHWDRVSDSASRAAVRWVVIRHEIDYKAPAFVGERLLARTWVGEPTAATWERFSEIRRASDDQLLAQCRSVYVALDPVSGRPRRVDAALRAPFGR
ncbi:MAG TPA: thioesterase family protein [Gemmatimonadales bacterium]|jgi:acyl-CoA thioester hydrolase|nr:thioesterase family protein [Gemmatimonadales bacterium]